MKICANQNAYIKDIVDDIKNKINLERNDVELVFALMQEQKIKEILTINTKVDKLSGCTIFVFEVSIK
jgi:hypothetical protein